MWRPSLNSSPKSQEMFDTYPFGVADDKGCTPVHRTDLATIYRRYFDSTMPHSRKRRIVTKRRNRRSCDSNCVGFQRTCSNILEKPSISGGYGQITKQGEIKCRNTRPSRTEHTSHFEGAELDPPHPAENNETEGWSIADGVIDKIPHHRDNRTSRPESEGKRKIRPCAPELPLLEQPAQFEKNERVVSGSHETATQTTPAQPDFHTEIEVIDTAIPANQLYGIRETMHMISKPANLTRN